MADRTEKPRSGLVSVLVEYAQRVWKHWWSVMVGAVGGAAFLISLFASIIIPTWLGVVILVLGLSLAQFLAFKDMRRERDEALKASEFSIGPSPRPRSPLERAVVQSLIAFEKIDRERAVQGSDGLFDRLMRCAGDVDLSLREVDAGDLYSRFREDGLRPPHGSSEQTAYLQRQIKLFQDALRQLRRDEAGQ